LIVKNFCLFEKISFERKEIVEILYLNFCLKESFLFRVNSGDFYNIKNKIFFENEY